MQQIMVLLILALVWAAVLIPQHVRNRADARPADSIGAFRKQLSVLERTSPGGAAPRVGEPGRPLQARRPAASSHPGRAMVRKRRRDILCGLLVAMGATLVLGFVPGLGAMHGVLVVLTLLFAGYVALLVRLRRAAREREAKVRYLPSTTAPGPEPEPALLLRRSGS